MTPSDFIGTVVMVGSVLLIIVAIIWLPILRRRELAQIAEQKKKPIFVELQGSIQKNQDGSDRSESVGGLSTEMELALKRQSTSGDEMDVGVVTKEGHLLGLLPAEVGRELSKELAAGRKLDVKIDLLTGGTEQNPDYYIKLVLKRRTQEKRKRKRR